MIRWVPLLPLLLALTACASPQQSCINAAAAPWREALKERERIAKDLARGYTFETKFRRVTRFTVCHDGERSWPCWDTDMQPVTRRVPVDTAALTRRDAEIARALPALRAAAERDAAQCRATYPEPPSE